MFKALKMKNVIFAGALLLTLCLIGCRNETQTDSQIRSEPEFTGYVLSGSTASPVRIEVFSDMQCPACSHLFVDVILPAMKEYQDNVNVVYYEFPLSGHNFSRPAARYIAAAAKLGQKHVLSVYDAIFNDQAQWSMDGNLEASVSRALSREDFLKVLQILRDDDLLAEIDRSIENERLFGLRRGVESTPTMFVFYGDREQKVEGTMPYPVMKQFLDSFAKP